MPAPGRSLLARSRSLSSREVFWGFAALFAVLIAVFLMAQVAGGQTWDELLDYDGVADQTKLTLRLLGGDFSAHFSQVESNFAFYGIIAVLPAYLAERLGAAMGMADSFPVYTFLLHATAFASSLVTVAVTYLLLFRLTRSRLAAATGGVLLALYPLWLGFSFFNHKDIPTACFATLALYAAVRLLQAGNDRAELRRASWVLGLATVLIGGLKIPALALIVPSWAAAFYVFHRRGELRLAAALCALTALAVFLVTPVSWTDPLHFLVQSVAIMSRHEWNGCTLTDGMCLAPHATDWSAADYLSKWYLAQLPVLIAAGAVMGLLASPWRGAERITVAASLVLPLLMITLRNSTLYDGLRHVLFTIPLIFILAVVFWHEVAVRSGMRSVAAAAAALTGLFIWDNAAMFPYNYVTFNLPTRQIADAGNFETDLWGFSLKQAARMPIVAQTPGPVLGNPPHLVRPYLEGPPRQMIPLYDQTAKLPPGSDAVVVSYTRGQPVPSWCTDPQYVTRQLPLGGRLLQLSYAARCKVS